MAAICSLAGSGMNSRKDNQVAHSIIENLPEKDKALLQYIKTFRDKNKYGPSIREILAALGWSNTSLVDYHIKQLERRGLVEHIERHPHSLKLTAFALGALA